MVCFHSDAGKEWRNKSMTTPLRSKNIVPARTSGCDPKSDGKSERYVGIIKPQATSYLLHSGMSLRFWHWAALQVADMYRVRALETKCPQDAPKFGHRAFVRDHNGETNKLLFEAKTYNELYLCCTLFRLISGSFA